jgi:hypothetical protein
MPRWAYDTKSHRYRNLDNGLYVSYDQVIAWSWAEATATGDVVAALGMQVGQGVLRVQDWQTLMRREIKDEYVRQYLVGRGGLAQMTPRDWGIIGHMLRTQYQFLDNFAQDVAAGRLSPAQIVARARLYIYSAQQARERARTEAFGMPVLPAYPGDGQTECVTHCRCNWIINPVQDGWEAQWRLDPAAESCHDCPINAGLWNPLFVPSGMTPRQEQVWRQREIMRMQEARV